MSTLGSHIERAFSFLCQRRDVSFVVNQQLYEFDVTMNSCIVKRLYTCKRVKF